MNTGQGKFIVPVEFRELNPRRNSIMFAGSYINLSAIARAISMGGLDVPSISRVFSGKRKPTLDAAKAISAVLGISIDAFLEALDEHIDNIEERQKRIVQLHDARRRSPIPSLPVPDDVDLSKI